MRKLLILFALFAIPLHAQTPSCGLADDGKIHGPFNPSMKATMTSTSTTSGIATIVLTSAPAWTPTANEPIVYEGSSNSAMNSYIGPIATVTDSQHFTVTITGQPNGTSTGGFVAPVDWNAKAVPASAGGSYLDGLGSLPGGIAPCPVYRLTADGNSFQDYSTVSAASNTGVYILVHGGTNGDRIIGGCPGANCGTVIVNTTTLNGSGSSGCQRSGDAWRLWDPLHENVQYYTDNTSLMRCTINGTNSVTSATVHTFSEYLNWVIIPDETDILPDGCTMPLIGQNSSVGGVSTLDIFVYNLCTNTKSHLYTTTVNGCANTPPTSSANGQPGPNNCIHKILEMADGTPIVQFEGAINNGDPAILATGCNQSGTPSVGSCNLSIDISGNLEWRQGNYTQCLAANPGHPSVGCSSHFDRSENQAGTVSYIVEVDEPPGYGNQPADPCYKQNGLDVKDYTTASNSTVGTVRCLDALANIGHVSSHAVSATMPYVAVAVDPWQAGFFTSNATNYRQPNTNCSPPFQVGSVYGVNSCWFLYQDEAFLININSAGNTGTPGIASGAAYRMFWDYSDSMDTTTPPQGGFYSQPKESLSPDGKHIIFTSTMACASGYTGTAPCTTGNLLTDVYEVSYTLSGGSSSPGSALAGGVKMAGGSAIH